MTGAELRGLLDGIEDEDLVALPVYTACEGPVGVVFLATSYITGELGIVLTRSNPPGSSQTVPLVPGTGLLESAREQRRGSGWRPRRNWWDGVLIDREED